MRYAIIALCTLCLAACGSRGSSKNRTAAPSLRYGYKIVASHPHDPAAYTQGLFWHEGALIESTGEYGRSTLRRVELETGTVTDRVNLSADVFAEGAALVEGKIYQLSWFEERCFLYDPATLELTSEFTYGGEGWGLTTDGERLYMSDGTPNIAVRNPSTFAVERSIVVRRDGAPVQHLNELEWIDGRIWANVYLTNEIVIIDPADGRVEATIDFTGITSQLEMTRSTDVMNGIAYDPDTKRVFVTGKNWNKLFEIEIVKK